MKIKILSLLAIILLSIGLFTLTGCGSGIESSMEEEGTIGLGSGIESSEEEQINAKNTYDTEAIKRVKNKMDDFRHPGITFEEALKRCGVKDMKWTEDADRSTSVITYVSVEGKYKGDQIKITHAVRSSTISYVRMTVNGEIESISQYDKMMKEMMGE